MRKPILMLCLLAVPAPFACAQLQPPPLINPVGPGVAPDPAIDEPLDALNARGKDLQDFTTDVVLSETDAITGAETQRIGKVWFQRLPNGDARIRVSFDRKKLSNKEIKQRIEYKLDKGKLVDQNFDTKLQVTRQVLKPGQKLDPLKLGEGPFPLPIGQPREEVLKSFDVKRIPPAKEDPADTIHLTLKPRPGSQFAKKFSSIDVYISKKSNFPVRIETVDLAGTTVRTTDLSNLRINEGVKEGDFTLPEPGKDWGVRDEALSE